MVGIFILSFDWFKMDNLTKNWLWNRFCKKNFSFAGVLFRYCRKCKVVYHLLFRSFHRQSLKPSLFLRLTFNHSVSESLSVSVSLALSPTPMHACTFIAHPCTQTHTHSTHWHTFSLSFFLPCLFFSTTTQSFHFRPLQVFQNPNPWLKFCSP